MLKTEMGDIVKQNHSKKSEKHIVLNIDQTISLMSVYLSEYEHRNGLLWKQVFKFYYVNLLTIVFPNIVDSLGIDIPKIPVRFFYIIGIIMAFLFLYIAIGTAMRAQASYCAYEKVAGLLEDGTHTYSRISLKDREVIIKYGKLFNPPLARSIILIMFASLLAIAVGLMCFAK